MNLQHEYKSGINSKQSFEKIGPGRHKIFITAIVWTFFAIVLFYRSGYLLLNYRDYFWLKVSGSLIVGILLYLLLFFKISYRHSQLTINLINDNPRPISFFDLKRDIFITVIAISGFLLRVSGVVPIEYVSIIYIATGLPLFLSTFRYYYYGSFYDKVFG
jgi:hypothetical protein